MQYKSKLNNWYKYSSIRNKPRRIISDKSDDGYYYPVARQPISIHPLVMNLGEEAVKYVLIQTAYKFMSDIAFVEIEMINKIAQKIYSNQYPIKFIDEIRTDALSIIIDEAFHAYVAIDYADQIKKKTKIVPLAKNKETELSYAIKKFVPILPKKNQEIFELIAGCIGENTLTKELFQMTSEKDVNNFFHCVMHDHMLDEGRHSKIFEDILLITWSQLDSESKKYIGAILPDFLFEYLRPDLDIEYSRKILRALNLTDTEAEKVIEETYTEHTFKNFKEKNPVIRNIVKMLNRCNLFECNYTKEAFITKHLI